MGGEKKAVLIPSTPEGEADGIQKLIVYTLATILWKCSKIFTPLCQGAMDQTHFHQHGEKNSIASTLYGK